MNINDIKNLNYNAFRKNRKEIVKYINHYFENEEMPYSEIYKKLNYILWGCNDIEILKNQNKYINECDCQSFYVNKNEPGFILIVNCTLNINLSDIYNDDNDLKFSDIKIKIKNK